MAHSRIGSFLFVTLCTVAPAAAETRALEARGPGAIFASIEAAAVDALTYAHLQARAAGDPERMRGGAIRASGTGYTYDEVHVAAPLTAHRVTYSLGPRDVARFATYPRDGHDVNRINEGPSRSDRRSVDVIDPLHRPLYILHPSLAIRVYRGKGHELAEVANLRRPRPSRAARAPELALEMTRGMLPP
jgi:hypothetical protein